MNEITKIHLGRQPFTISVAAYKELKSYLDAIKKQTTDSDVTDEVELRMSELLIEHGVTGEKVILPADVEYLKEQLGTPKDFHGDSDDEAAATKSAEGRRLFRDSDNAMLAGVAAGLAKYFGIDVVFIRLLFLLGVVTGGWSILLYIVLWLLVPEARTSSDRLLMVGKPVTVDSIKELMERADVRGVAQRANNSFAMWINRIFDVLLKLTGVVFIVVGLSSLFSLLAVAVYTLLHSGSVVADNLFPVGIEEHVLLYLSLAVTGMAALFVVLMGMAMFRRKWPIKTWITGLLIGLTLISGAGGAALAVDTIPNVIARYNANVHTTVRTVQPFDSVHIMGSNVRVEYQPAANYSVSLQYYDHPDLAAIKTTVANGVLSIDSSQFDWHHYCQALCIPHAFDISITVNAPNADMLAPNPSFPQKPILIPVPPRAY